MFSKYIFKLFNSIVSPANLMPKIFYRNMYILRERTFADKTRAYQDCPMNHFGVVTQITCRRVKNVPWLKKKLKNTALHYDPSASLNLPILFCVFLPSNFDCQFFPFGDCLSHVLPVFFLSLLSSGHLTCSFFGLAMGF